MDAMKRCAARIAAELDDGRNVIRQKRLAEYLGKSEAWITNIIKGKRGIRLVDLDRIADFLRIPPAELIRSPGDEMVELTPSEMDLLRKLRRMAVPKRDAIYALADSQPPAPPPEPPRKQTIREKKSLPKRDRSDDKSDIRESRRPEDRPKPAESLHEGRATLGSVQVDTTQENIRGQAADPNGPKTPNGESH